MDEDFEDSELDARAHDVVLRLTKELREGGDGARYLLRRLWREGYDIVGFLTIAFGDEEQRIDQALEALFKDWAVYWKRKVLWERAAEELLWPEPDSRGDLAFEAQNLRYLEQNHPDWRETYKKMDQHKPDAVAVIEEMVLNYPNWPKLLIGLLIGRTEGVPDCIKQFKSCWEEGQHADPELDASIKSAAAFEERKKKAELEKDYAFFRRYSEALHIPDDEIVTKLMTFKLPGLVLAAWRDLGGFDFLSATPTKAGIKSWVETKQKEMGELQFYSDRHWKDTWEDPFISAVFRG
jgi:hypothetical protein